MKFIVALALSFQILGACKSSQIQNTAEEASLRDKSLGGKIFATGNTDQVFFHALPDNDICIYAVSEKNSQRSSNGQGSNVGNMKQVVLFREFASAFPDSGMHYAINFDKFSALMGAELSGLKAEAERLYTEQDEPCRNVAMNKAAASGGECAWRGDATACNAPRTLGGKAMRVQLPGWAVCERGVERVECMLNQYDPSCECRKTEYCLEGKGKRDQGYANCVYSSSRDETFPLCKTANSQYEQAQQIYSFKSQAFQLIKGEADRVLKENGKVATEDDIRNINGKMLSEVKLNIRKYYDQAKSSQECPTPKKIPL